MALLQLDFIKIQRNEGKEPIYTSEEVKDMVLHTICLEFDEVTDITPDVRLTLYNSGHILGSSMVHLNIGNGLHNLLYTGDLKFARTHLLDQANTSFPRLETVIIEATYGGKENVMAEQQADDYLADVIVNTVKNKGKVLIPVLGSGRAQEVMVLVDKLIKEKKIDPIKVYLDGLLWDITAIHSAYPEYLNRTMRQLIFHENKNPFLSDVFQRVGSQNERKQVIDSGESCVILATSGMLFGGPSVEYLKGLAENKRNALVFSCYQPPGSLGRRILSGEKEIMYAEGGKNVPLKINLDVHRVEITSHSDRVQLMNFIRRCNPSPKKVIVNHGESSKCLDLASSLHKQFRIETTAPKNLEVVRIR
jgi:hypothetical protein